MRNCRFLPFSAAVAATSFAATVRAAPLVYDGFKVPADYTANAGFHGKAPATTGFGTGAWTSLDPVNSFGEFATLAAGLEYAGLKTEAGHVKFYRSGGSSTSAKVAYRLLAPDATARNEYWFSALLQFDGKIGNVKVSVPIKSGATTPLTFGFKSGKAHIFNVSGFDSATTYSANTTHFCLVKWVQSGSADNLRLWVDPDLSLGQPADGSAAVVYPGNSMFDGGVVLASVSGSSFVLTAQLSSTGGAGQTCYFDEVRVGTSFADVAPSSAPPPTYKGTVVVLR